MLGSTTNKLKYIKPTNNKYGDLGAEIIDLHTQIYDNTSKVSDANGKITVVKEDIEAVKNIANNLSTAVKDELNKARGNYKDLNDRLNNMSAYTITDALEMFSSTRIFSYDKNGNISKESVRGELSYDVIYSYDSDGNITGEEYYDVNDKLLGVKTYGYDNRGNIVKVTSNKADILAIVTNSLATKEINDRLSKLEAIDFIKAATILNGNTAAVILKSIQDLEAQVQNLEVMLPDNITSLVSIPDMLARIETLENRMNANYIVYEFVITSGIQSYTIPEGVTSKSAVYLEGLLLEYGEDFTIDNDKITFKIPLIDAFTITCRY